jgi:hypothetical protein
MGLAFNSVYALGVAELTSTLPSHPDEMGMVSLTFYPGCPQTVILLISVSQVSRITAVNHQVRLGIFFG